MTNEDTVKREAVLNTLDAMDAALDEDRTVEAYKELLKECYKTLPPVAPKQKTGKWIAGKTIGDGFTCSECGTQYKVYPIVHNYCPHCGAKMEGEE